MNVCACTSACTCARPRPRPYTTHVSDSPPSIRVPAVSFASPKAHTTPGLYGMKGQCPFTLQTSSFILHTARLRVQTHMESRFTHHTSHITLHTSHVTRHTSHVTRHTPPVTLHTPGGGVQIHMNDGATRDGSDARRDGRRQLVMQRTEHLPY